MELDAFTARLGVTQGRLATSEGVAFVLGDVDAGRFAELVVGDRVDLVQDLDVTGVALVRVELTLRAPRSLPTDLAWEASVLVDGEKRARVRCAAGRTKHTSELAANVSKLTGVHEVGVRLELVEA